MKFNKVHHTAIICSDYQKSKSFYTDILGGSIIKETYRAERNSYKLDISIAGSQIELFSFPNPPTRISNPEACGLRHLAFEVESIEKTVKDLSDRGVEAEEVRVDEITNKKFTFFRDPDGLPIEIYEK
ncbi:MAG: VOC family protein [Candidatus Magasanikbacteria bacterium]|nr:VOC family protein [Candidatus Magasanikbacteria bacterium]